MDNYATQRKEPFIWTKTPDDILNSIKPKTF
jgi:hypothetical protein